MADLLSYLFIGLSLGAIYAFIALGYSMVYGVIRLINFAHGELFMLGGFAGYLVLRDAGIDRLPLPQPLPAIAAYLTAVLAGAVCAGLLAVTAERLCYRPIRKAGRIAALLTAVGLSLFLQNMVRQVAGPSAREYPQPRIVTPVSSIKSPARYWYYEDREFTTSSGEVTVTTEPIVREGETLSSEVRARLERPGAPMPYRQAGLTPSEGKLGIVLMLVACAASLWFLVRRTRMGKAMRAVSEDMPAAQLMGIPVDRVVMATFWLGGIIAGMGGVAYCATYGSIEPLTGFMPGLKAFVAAVLGGIGSIPGAVVGGVFLGVVETLFGRYVSTEWKDALAFVVLILVLLVKPTGLLGKARREKV